MIRELQAQLAEESSTRNGDLEAGRRRKSEDEHGRDTALCERWDLINLVKEKVCAPPYFRTGQCRKSCLITQEGSNEKWALKSDVCIYFAGEGHHAA